MTSKEHIITGQLERVEKTGVLEGLSLELWRGGGLPPPYYKSDQLRFLSVSGHDTVEFASLRFDASFDPPSVQDKWTIPAATADVKEAARLLLSLKVLETQFPEERPTGVADAISWEVIALSDGAEVQRRYYGKLPDELAPLQAFIDRMVGSAKASGRPVLFHQGRPVTQPPQNR